MRRRWYLMDGEEVAKNVRDIALTAMHDIMHPPVQHPEDDPISPKYYMSLGVIALLDKIEYTIRKEMKEDEEERARERETDGTGTENQ